MDVEKLRGPSGGLSHYRHLLNDMAKHVRPTTLLFRNGVPVAFTDSMKATIRSLLAELGKRFWVLCLTGMLMLTTAPMFASASLGESKRTSLGRVFTANSFWHP